MRLQSYLLGRVLVGGLMTLLVLTAVLMVLSFAELLDELGRSYGSLRVLIELLALKLPEALLSIGSLALLVGAIVALAELAGGDELVVMRASGMAPGVVLRPLLLMTLCWAGALFWLSGWVQPAAERRADDIAEHWAGDWLLNALQPGRFVDLGVEGLSVQVDAVDRAQRRVEGVFVHFRNERSSELITARWGRLISSGGKRRLELVDGVHISHAGDPPGLPMRRVEFERNVIELPERSDRTRPSTLQRSNLDALWRDRGPGARLELMRRLTAPLSGLLMLGFVLPVTLGGRRDRTWTALLATVTVCLVYTNWVLLLLDRAAERGAADAPLMVYLLHMVPAIVSAALLLRWWRRW